MKRLLISLLAVWLLLPTVGFAQSDLGDFLVRFCNDNAEDAKQLFFEAQSGIPHPICVKVSNLSTSQIRVDLDFVDGTVTADADQRKACATSAHKENFWQYVTFDNDTITIPAQQAVVVTGTVNFPSGYAGMSYGCVTSSIHQEEDPEDESMFKIVSRRANFIDVLVQGDIELGLIVTDQPDSYDNLSNNPQIAIYYDEPTESYKARLTLKNTGNVPQEITASPEIRTFPGNQHQIAPITNKVLPRESSTVEFDITEYIPIYQGPIDLIIDIETKPVFEFQSDEITDEMKLSKSIYLTARMVLIPWEIIGGVILVLVVLMLLGRRGKGDSSTTGSSDDNTPGPQSTSMASRAAAVSGSKKKAPAKKRTSRKKTSTTKKSSTRKSTGSKKSTSTAKKSSSRSSSTRKKSDKTSSTKKSSRRASTKKSSSAPTSKGTKDDLAVIKGIGPKASEALAAAGITTFADLASAGVKGAQKALEQAGGRLASTDPTSRVKEAKKIASRG